MRSARTITIGGGADNGGDDGAAAVIGGGFPVLVQTMWKDRLSFSDLEKKGAEIVERIGRLARMGCGLLRFAVPDLASAEAVGALASLVSMPLSADIHFDYKIALRCLDFPIAKIRLNPGNIGGRERVERVLSKAAARGTPIRIGVNGGSLPRDLGGRVDSGALGLPEAMVLAAERELAVFEEFGFTEVLVSMKASGIADTIKANRMLAERSDVPLHIGVTEAGPPAAGITRSALALGTLLEEGIGDTLRVSLSASMEEEIIAGREILRAVHELCSGGGCPGGAAERLVRRGVTLVSCPRCGRNSFDTHGFTEKWREYLYSLDKDITVAVMGCAVNGPGEARHADLGITGAGNKVLLFRTGRLIRTIDAAEADAAFREELEKL